MEVESLIKKEEVETLAEEKEESPTEQMSEEKTLINKIKELEAQVEQFKRADIDRNYSEVLRKNGIDENYKDWISELTKNDFETSGVLGVEKRLNEDKFKVFKTPKKESPITVPTNGNVEIIKENKKETTEGMLEII